MHTLYRTAALALVMGSVGFAAHAQQGNSGTTTTEGGTANAPSFCDQQWSAVDGNANGFVSRSEAASAIQNNFSAIDADGNGEITKTEYVDCRTGLELAAAPVERDEETFSAADADEDDQLSRQEYRNAARDAYNQAQRDDAVYEIVRRYTFLTPTEAGDQSFMDGMSKDEAAARSTLSFNALDTNNDDMISMTEWQNQDVSFQMSEEEAGAQFDAMDADSDAAVSQGEYEEARTKDIDAMPSAATGGESASDSMANSARNAESGANGDSAEAEETAGSDQQASADPEASGVPVFVYWFY